MIPGLRDHQVYAIIDVKLGDADMDTFRYDPMISLLARWKNIKKDNHGKHCQDQHKNRFAVCYFSEHGAREGRPSRDL